MAEAAVEAGHNPLFQNNVTFVVILWGGLTTNLIWTTILSLKNKTYGDFTNKNSPQTKPHGRRSQIGNQADQTDFDLVGLPENRELRSSWAVNSLASVLSMLDLQSVRTDEAVDWASAVNMRLLVFSGMSAILIAQRLFGVSLF